MCRLNIAGLFEIPSLLQSTNVDSLCTYFINNVTDEFVSFWQLRGAAFNSSFQLLCFALRFHFAVRCLCSLSGVLIGVPAAERVERVARAVEMNVDTTNELQRVGRAHSKPVNFHRIQQQHLPFLFIIPVAVCFVGFVEIHIL